MNILIVENELYLAQSVSNNLISKLGAKCEIVTTSNEATALEEKFDVVLLSTNASGNIYHAIEKYEKSVIILLVSYINNDTITQPLKAGADDYISKPFMIEELIRKIEHLMGFKQTIHENKSYEEYLSFFFSGYESVDLSGHKFPMFVKSKHRKSIDKSVFELSKSLKQNITFIDLENRSTHKLIANNDNILYMVNIDKLKKSEIEEILSQSLNKQAVIELKNDTEIAHPHIKTIAIESQNQLLAEDEILSIEDYIKYVIKNYEHKFPDTTLSKKLGISRKSLWEKRKKYELFKKR